MTRCVWNSTACTYKTADPSSPDAGTNVGAYMLKNCEKHTTEADCTKWVACDWQNSASCGVKKQEDIDKFWMCNDPEGRRNNTDLEREPWPPGSGAAVVLSATPGIVGAAISFAVVAGAFIF